MKKIFIFTIVLVFIIIGGCSKQQKNIEIGDNVIITYQIIFQNQEVLKDIQKQEIKVGEGILTKIIEDSIIGLKEGQKIEVSIEPQDLYGKNYDISKTQEIPKIIFDRMGIIPEIGKNYKIGDLNGSIISIQGSGDFQIFTIDTNPRETYETLTYKIKINKIIK